MCVYNRHDYTHTNDMHEIYTHTCMYKYYITIEIYLGSQLSQHNGTVDTMNHSSGS